MVTKRPIGRLRAAMPGLVVLGVLCAAVDPPRHSGNVWSRYMTIESIVERRTLVIEGSPLLPISGSPDVAKFGGRLYSDKPPVLPGLGALVYAPMYAGGLRIGDLRSPDQFVLVNRVLVLALVGSSTAMALVAVRLMLQAIDIRRWLADLLGLGLGLGSLLLVYGVTFNNHSVAAGLLSAAFALVLLRPSGGRAGAVRAALAGLLAGLGATIDLPAGGLVWLGLLVWVGARSRRAAVAYLAGSAPPIALHCVLQTLVTGTPLPVEFYPEALAFEGSYWASEEGRFVETVPRWRFLLEMLIGPQGWLTVTPVLAFVPVGLVLAIIGRRDPMRTGAIVVALVLAVLLGFYSFGVRRTDFAGQSFGTRHLLPVTPIAFVYAVAVLEHLRHGFWKLLFVGLMLVGGVYASEGLERPWSRIEARDDLPLRVAQRFVLYPHSSDERGPSRDPPRVPSPVQPRRE